MLMLYYFLLLLPCFANLFWSATLACRVRRNLRPQNIWIGTSLLLAVNGFIWATYLSGNERELFYRMDIVEAFTMLAFPAFLYFYYRSLTDERPLTWRDAMWLLPALLIGTGTVVLYSAVDGQQAPAIMSEMSHGGASARQAVEPTYRVLYFVSVTLYNIAARLQLLAVVVYAVIRYLRYRRRLDDFFSNPEGKSMENNRTMLWLVFALLLCLVAASAGRFYYYDHQVWGCCIMAATGIVSFAMGYNVCELKYTAADLAGEERRGDLLVQPRDDTSEKDKSTAQIDGKQARLAAEFDRLMDQDHIFLQNDLRLDDVALMMNTNRTYISRMINERYGLSFSEVVNRRRIAWARELLSNNPGMLQEQVAEASGFMHASAFSRMFRQVTGTTYRESIKRNSLE